MLRGSFGKGSWSGSGEYSTTQLLNQWGRNDAPFLATASSKLQLIFGISVRIWKLTVHTRTQEARTHLCDFQS